MASVQSGIIDVEIPLALTAQWWCMLMGLGLFTVMSQNYSSKITISMLFLPMGSFEAMAIA